jgi:glyoxylase-like metal-dependent hydrolase (beta-lactamase superfamily II)
MKTLFALLAATVHLVALPPLVHQVAPGVYYRESQDDRRIIATTSWIEFKDFLLVIDANFPWGAKAILHDVEQTTPKPIRFVLDTHYHGDHSYGNGVFAETGATIVSSDAAAEDSRNLNTKSWANDKGVGERDLKQYPLVHPQLTFKDRITIEDGSRRVELIRVGPGHTRGDAIAWLPEERIVFTGDLCTTRAQNNLGDPGMDPDGWLKILDNVIALNPAIVVPGHGRDGGVDAVRGQRAYLSEIFEAVRAGLRKGESAQDVYQHIDWTRHKPWSGDENRNRANVTAAYKKISSLQSKTAN